MDKIMTKEVDFIFEPTYDKVKNNVEIIKKELINIIGEKYSEIINNRVDSTYIVFFNRITDLEKYCNYNSKELAHTKNKKMDLKYTNINKSIINYKEKISKLKKNLRIEFIMNIKEYLSGDDQTYITNKKRIDVKKLKCYDVFFNDLSDDLINGTITYFSPEMEEKFKSTSTSIIELETIINNRESCLKKLGMSNINVQTFDRKNIIPIIEKIDFYNNKYLKTSKEYNIDESIIKNITSDKFIKSMQKNDKEIIDKLNTIEESQVFITTNKDVSVKYLLYSPTIDFKHNDFLFIKQICKIALDYDFFNFCPEKYDDDILGIEKYNMYSNLIIDHISYQILKRLNEKEINLINSKKELNIFDINDGLFLVSEFYEKYSDCIIESLINNDKTIIYNIIGILNFENLVNIINKYYYDNHGNIMKEKERSKSSFSNFIKKLLNITLSNIEQYIKIVDNVNKYGI